MGEEIIIPNNEKYNEIRACFFSLSKAEEAYDIAVFSRAVLEALTKLIYSEKKQKYPKEATLLEVLDSSVIIHFLSHDELMEMGHIVRKLGMDAKNGVKIKTKQAELARNNTFFLVQYVINKLENPSQNDKLILPKYMSETETRKIYIDHYLNEAGWDVLETNTTTALPSGMKIKSGSVYPGKACVEIPVSGMKSNESGIGFCDYVLYDDNGKPLAIVEAKKTSADITTGVAQVKEYGECMRQAYGYVPVLYYTNGYEIHVIDGLYNDRKVMGFHSKRELQLLIHRRKRTPIDNSKIDKNIAGRTYQIRAITKVYQRFNEKFRRNLLVMATGTGKTRTSIALVKGLLENGWVNHVLFLADRTTLVEQAFKEFHKHLPDTTYQVLSDKKLANDPDAKMVFSTHQTMVNYIDAEDKAYTCGRFDLIIIDEAHRSIFNKYGSIFKYFDSLIVGLTATPRTEVGADTYKLLDCEDGQPHFEYKLEEAIEVGYLVPYKVEARTTNLIKNGIQYKNLSKEDREKIDTIFSLDDEAEDFLIPKEELFQRIYNENTCAKVLQDLMDNGLRVDSGQKIGKTIIFAYNHKHAALIVDVFKKIYPDYGDDYCQLVDNYVKNADVVLNNFKEKDEFRIAVSVDMLDTGVDVPSILNLVIFKPIRSRIKFVQMLGRGTRTCEGLIDGNDKKYFIVFDYFENFDFFDEHPDMIENNNGKSLSQKVFDMKLNMLVELQSYQHQLNPVTYEYYKLLRSVLFSKILHIKNDCSSRIAVREEMPYVDKYVIDESWNAISPLAKKEIQKHLTRLVDSEEKQDPKKLSFDLHVYKIEYSVLSMGDISNAQKSVELIRNLAKYLLKYAAAQSLVREQAPLLLNLEKEDFWDNVQVDALENVREKVRDLLIYLPSKGETIQIDVPDEVKPGTYSGPLIDIRTYKEKVIDYLAEHMDNATIKKIQNLEKIDAEDLKELERILWQELGTKEEYEKSTDIGNLAAFIRTIIGLDQKVVDEKFSEFLSDNILNSDQMEFVATMVDYVRQNGDIIGEDLIEKKPFDSYSIQDLFGYQIVVLQKVLSVLHDSIVAA